MELPHTTQNDAGSSTKEEWTKPEIDIFGIKDNTLGLLAAGQDSFGSHS